MLKARTCSAFLLATFLLVLVAALVACRQANAAESSLAWHGHSAFSLTSPGGTVVVMDPTPKRLGYEMPVLRADVVTLSHEHFDHLALEEVLGEPTILRGVTANGRRCRPIDERIGDVRVRTVATFHDADRGRERGPNAIFVFETAGQVLVHLGDLGHTLNRTQIDQIGPVDVLLVPVGGKFTLGARQATEVVQQLAPRRHVIPMHYATGALALDLPLAGVGPFLERSKYVRRHGSGKLSLGGPPPQHSPTIVVLTPEVRAG